MAPSAPSSRIVGFHKSDLAQRIESVAQFASLTSDERALLLNTGNLPVEMADHLIENFVGTMNIPVGIATNMKIDGRDRLIPWPPKNRPSLPQCAMPRASAMTVVGSSPRCRARK